MGKEIFDKSLVIGNIYSFHFLFSYDCEDREAEDDELNGNDEDEDSDGAANEEGKFRLSFLDL